MGTFVECVETKHLSKIDQIELELQARIEDLREQLERASDQGLGTFQIAQELNSVQAQINLLKNRAS